MVCLVYDPSIIVYTYLVQRSLPVWVPTLSKTPIVYLCQQIDPPYTVLVGSRNGFECDFHKQNNF